MGHIKGVGYGEHPKVKISDWGTGDNGVLGIRNTSVGFFGDKAQNRQPAAKLSTVVSLDRSLKPDDVVALARAVQLLAFLLR